MDSLHAFDEGPVQDEDQPSPQRAKDQTDDTDPERLARVRQAAYRIDVHEYRVLKGEHHRHCCDTGSGEHDETEADKSATF